MQNDVKLHLSLSNLVRYWARFSVITLIAGVPFVPKFAISMPTISFTRAVGLVLFYFYTGCCCLVIPYHDNAEVTDRIAKPSERTIQMCGTKLTSIIISICDGYIISPSESFGGFDDSSGFMPSSIDHRGVAEKCCKNECNLEFLLQHCGENSRSKKLIQSRREAENEVSYYTRENSSSTTEPSEERQKTTSWAENKQNDMSQVRIRDGKNNHKGGHRRRKAYFTADSVYKSFGHFILNMHHGGKNLPKIRKRKNVPSFEVGTIKPDILGGDPVVVGTRSSKGTFHISSNYINSYRRRGKSIVSRY